MSINLPLDLTKQILSYLPPSDLAENVGRVSHPMNTLSNDSLTWKTMAARVGIPVELGQPSKPAVLMAYKKCDALNRLFLTAFAFIKKKVLENPKTYRAYSHLEFPQFPETADPIVLHNLIKDYCERGAVYRLEGTKRRIVASDFLSVFAHFQSEHQKIFPKALNYFFHVGAPKELYNSQLDQFFEN
jgi:hypothetical protein